MFPTASKPQSAATPTKTDQAAHSALLLPPGHVVKATAVISHGSFGDYEGDCTCETSGDTLIIPFVVTNLHEKFWLHPIHMYALIYFYLFF
jgi:hypothetical protein